MTILTPSGQTRAAAPHRYDHVVVVVEENRAVGQIIGDWVNAPYVNSLATNGVRLGNMFGITHPSQVNYMHLFSGADQGVLDDNLPPNFSTTPTASYPFTAPNLGAGIVAAGFTFAGYCEEIESAGVTDWADYDPHTATHPGISYRRKHNPWANWVAKVLPVPANQMTSTVNRAFTVFPTNFTPAGFAALPTVSFVVPNQLHDMHDGSRKQGDDWLRDNLGNYARWARTNNSLLVVTWDEDDYNSVNQIPTVFYGAGLRDGTVVGGTWTLHNLLRTLEDMYGSATHAGAAAQVRPIVGAFADDPPVTQATFRQGLAGYNEASDTQLWAETPGANHATTDLLTTDLDTGAAAGSQAAQVLVRFSSVFGNGAGQVPTNATIQSAKLILFTPLSPVGADYDSSDVFRAHRMLVEWNDTDTWNSLGGGVSTDDLEAASTASFSIIPEVDGAPAIFDVTSDVELYRTGTTNRGWLIRPSTSGTGNGWSMASSEWTPDLVQRPTLEITYSVTSTNSSSTNAYSVWAAAKGLTPLNSSPTADADGDGASNLAEFSYNMNPLVPDARPMASNGTNGLPRVRVISTGGGTLEMQFLRRKGPNAAGLTYAAQFSASVAGPWISGQPPIVVSINADWERVVVRDTVTGPNPQRFGKVGIALAP